MRWRYLLAASLLPSILPLTAQAAGVSISPAFQEVQVVSPESEVSFTIQIGNDTPHNQTVRLSVVDFGQLSESGGIAFQGTSTNQAEKKYGLASWLSLERDVATIPAGQSVDIRTTVINKDSLSPGGHYAGIVATFTEEQAPNQPVVAIQQALSSLVFVQKVGGEVYDVNVAGIQYHVPWSTLPQKISLRFHNGGNMFVVPRGRVELLTRQGKLVAKGSINAESAYVLPESFRVMGVPLTSLVSPFALWPGQYTLRVLYRYDGKDDFATQQQTFWYLGTMGLMLIGIAAVAVLALLKKIIAR